MQERASQEFENADSFEMAYIAKWSICEHIIKELYIWQINHQTYCLMKEWVAYFDLLYASEKADKPNTTKIGNIIFKTDSLPEFQKFIVEVYKNCKELHMIMDPKGKYRKKRNEIAHNASKLQKDTYKQDYSPKIDEAIKELFGFISE